MPEFSIITCISKPDIYGKCVLDSVNSCRAGHDIELVPVWNLENLYSASLALNVGIDASRSDILVICHQDIRLLGSWFDTLKTVIGQLDDNWAILGAAGIALEYSRDDIGDWGGAKKLETVAVGSVWGDDIVLDELPYWDGIKLLTRVHCVDECLFVFNKRTGLRFDLQLNGFHFYGVDLCLQARTAAFGVYAAELPIVHYGKYSASFSSNSRYWPFFRQLRDKWKTRFPELLGTHMHWVGDDELTTYIPFELQANDGSRIQVKSMGVKEIKLYGDPI